jgi:hypothetical protein
LHNWPFCTPAFPFYPELCEKIGQAALNDTDKQSVVCVNTFFVAEMLRLNGSVVDVFI